MSDRQSKNYDESTRVSGGNSAPIAYKKRKNDDKTVWDRLSAPHDHTRQKQSRIQSKPKRGIGNKNGGVDLEEIEIVKIDEAEWKNNKTCSMPKIGSSTRKESGGPSTRKGIGDAHFAATSRKNVVGASKYKHSIGYPRKAAGPRSDQGWLDKSGSIKEKGNNDKDMYLEEIEIEKIDEAEFFMNREQHLSSTLGSSTKRDDGSNGSDSEDTFPGEFEIEKIDEAEFRNQKKGFMSKRGTSTGQKLTEGHSAATCSSDGEDTPSEEVEIEKIDEAEFRKHKTHSMSKIGHSTAQELAEGHSAATCSKNVDGASKNIVFVDLCPSSEDCATDSDPMLDNKKGNKTEYSSSKSIKDEGVGEAQFKGEMSSFASKVGSSNRQGVGTSAAYSNKNDEVVKEVSFNGCCRSFSSDMGETDESSSEKENTDEDMDLEKNEIEKIDESEFRKKRIHFALKIGSPTSRRGVKEGHVAETSRKNVNNMKKSVSYSEKNDKHKKKKEVSAYLRRKKVNEDGNRNLKDNENKRSVECSSSHSSRHTYNYNSSLQGDQISSYASGYDINLGISSRTRSRTNIIEKPSEFNHVSLDSSDDSESSSTDTGCYSSDDEDFEVDGSHNSDDEDSEAKGSHNSDYIDLLGSFVEPCEIQNDTMMKVSKEKSENCSKQERNDVNHASKRRCSSNIQSRETISKQPAFQRQKISARKRQLSHDGSSKQTRGRKAHKTYEVHEQNEETNRIIGDEANAEEALKEINAKRDSLPEFTHSKQSDTGRDFDAAEEVTGVVHPKDQSQSGTSAQKKALCSSHLEDECHQGNDDYDVIQQKIDATSSHFHGDGENEKLHVADEIQKLTKRKQVSSKHYDFCRVLADSVLESRPMVEMEENDEVQKQAPDPQTEGTLPLKFRFEDEVPKEVEETEFEKELEGLFADLDFSWALEELGSFNYPEVDQENANAAAGETLHARCARGKHELVEQDDQGLICVYCHHVELEPRDLLPQWVDKSCFSERKQHSGTEQLQEFDGLHLHSSMNNLCNFSNSANGTVWGIKPGVRESMYEHQQEGFEFLWKNLAGSININELKSIDPSGVGGCIISHAPGTGKTRLTIVFVESYFKMFPNCRPMIICPASMLLTWEEEFRKWNVDFPFYNLNNLELLGKENKIALRILSGAKGRNKDAMRMVKIYSWNMGGSILGISYSLFEKLTGEKYINEKTSKKGKRVVTTVDKMEALRKILLEKPGLVVLDEGHTPRNQRSNIWNVLLKLKTQKRVILSGTPFQNNFAELFNTVRLVRPAIADALAQEKTFAEMITSRRKYSQSSEGIDRAVERLKVSMSPFVHVHKGTILKQSLPGLRDCVVLLKPPPLQKSLIERLEGSQSTFQFEHKVALISVHPYLFQHCDSTEEQRIGIDIGAVEASKVNPKEGVKTKFILEFVRLCAAMNEKVLIFSQYIQPLELIKEQLKEIFKWVEGKQILQMHGGFEQKQRQILINMFNDPQSESRIMLASTKCCSEGISLVGASRVVLLDVVWNPSVERQAICRAYRIGQKKFVYTYHLMTLGTTEADKYCRQAEKERLSELVFTSSSNESNREKHSCLGIEDRILEEMVGHEKLKEMFEKIINQPKDVDLIQTFGLTS